MKRRAGFTLIELVIVIMILGILAGVAAPKLFSTSATAKDNGLKQTLAIIRDAIELYAGKYGALPPCTSTGTDFKTALVEFMRIPSPTQFPAAPVGTAQNNLISPGSGAAPLAVDGTPTAGWKYNVTTGQFIVNSSAASVVGGTYDTF